MYTPNISTFNSTKHILLNVKRILRNMDVEVEGFLWGWVGNDSVILKRWATEDLITRQ